MNDETAMSCAQAIPPQYVRIGISSAFSNMVNFVLVDVMLVTIIFHLTSELAGYVNSLSALTETNNNLYVNCSWLFGVGLTCTRRKVFRMLAFIRIATLVAVMATNFLIEGVACEAVRIIPQRTLVPGIVSLPVTRVVPEVIRPLIVRRSNCMGHERGMSYYGELRVGETCELRRELFMNSTIFWGLRYVQREIRFPDKCEMDVISQNTLPTIRWRCDDFGVVACMIRTLFGNEMMTEVPRGKEMAVLETCRGVLLIKDETGNRVSHMCEGDALFPGTPQQPRTSRMDTHAKCRVVKGMDENDSRWVFHLRILGPFNFEDVLHLTFGADVMKLPVKVAAPNKIKYVSWIHVAYFYTVGGLCLLIFVLVVSNIFCYVKGLRPVANDELGLGSLLRTNSSSILSDAVPSIGNNAAVILLQRHRGVLRVRIGR